MRSLPCHNIPEHYRISIKSNIKLIYFDAVEMIIDDYDAKMKLLASLEAKRKG